MATKPRFSRRSRRDLTSSSDDARLDCWRESEAARKENFGDDGSTWVKEKGEDGCSSLFMKDEAGNWERRSLTVEEVGVLDLGEDGNDLGVGGDGNSATSRKTA